MKLTIKIPPLSKDRFSVGEEIANAIVHGVGAALAIAALVLLIVFGALSGDGFIFAGYLVFGLSLVILYINSTMLHSLPVGTAKKVFEILDHGSVYVLIAGTYTPFLLIALRDAWGWVLFGILWGLALVGIIAKSFYVDRFRAMFTFLYVLMGWIIVFKFEDLVTNVSQLSLIFLVIGGVLYTVGTLFYIFRLFKFHHMIWHMFVIAGSTFHFFSVLLLQ